MENIHSFKSYYKIIQSTGSLQPGIPLQEQDRENVAFTVPIYNNA